MPRTKKKLTSWDGRAAKAAYKAVMASKKIEGLLVDDKGAAPPDGVPSVLQPSGAYEGCSFSNMVVSSTAFDAGPVTFVGCAFDNVAFSMCSFHGLRFVDCDLKGCSFHICRSKGGLRFEGCSVAATSFYRNKAPLVVEGSTLVGCSFAHNAWKGSSVSDGSVMRNSTFRDQSWTGMSFQAATFIGCRFDKPAPLQKDPGVRLQDCCRTLPDTEFAPKGAPSKAGK